MHFELFKKKKIKKINKKFITFLRKTFIRLLNRKEVTSSLARKHIRIMHRYCVCVSR